MTDKYLTVTALTRYIKRKIDTDQNLQDIWLKGEISNFKHHSRGHMYMTIKDQQSRIQAVMFAGQNRFLKFTPENGMHVFIRGEVSVYEPFGQYQLYIKQMEPDGIGALYLAYEQLKERLEKRGYFSKEHKKDIPAYPKHIGIITSPTGAAVRDIMTTIKRRYPIAQMTIIPASVQGMQAASSIKEAIELANELNMFDVLIVGRGGGSIEELWAFNEEKVAEAIFQSEVPIVSAVGHETDVTISDYVADLRAPTPTSAAELVVPSLQQLKVHLKQRRHQIIQLTKHLIQHKKQSYSRLMRSYAFKYPEHLIREKDQQLDTFTTHLHQTMKASIGQERQKVNHLLQRLKAKNMEEVISHQYDRLYTIKKQMVQYIKHIYQTKEQRLNHLIEQLVLLNPLEIMKRGFAIPYLKDGTIIKTIQQVKEEEPLNIKLFDGSIKSKVLHVKENSSGRKGKNEL